MVNITLNSQVLALTGAVLFLAIAIARILPKHDPREPPKVPPLIRVPLIGHILGLLKHGNQYYALAG
jgi:hypothetical protein